MKRFKNMSAQGEVLFVKVDKLPDGVNPVKAENGKLIVAHSETGHHHWMNAAAATLYQTDDPMVSYLEVKDQDTDLIHDRSFDTHENLRFDPGIYQVRHQREHTPDGWRAVQD